jgi:secondary thiamine-phosphate synthase enzyme
VFSVQWIVKYLSVETPAGISLHNLTAQIQTAVTQAEIQQGQVLVFSQHTTTALAINEDEERLWADIQTYLRKLAPAEAQYLHNDLHLRVVPPDEPMNAHSHLMAIILSSSEVIPVIDGKLALGTYQSLLFLDLDGPRTRQVLLQISGSRV